MICRRRSCLKMLPRRVFKIPHIRPQIWQAEKVTEVYATLVQKYPRDPNVREAYGAFLWQIDQHNEAVAQWFAGENLDPKNDAIAFRLGDAYLTFGDVKKAVGYLMRASELAPKNARHHFDLGNALYLFPPCFNRRANAERRRGRIARNGGISHRHETSSRLTSSSRKLTRMHFTPSVRPTGCLHSKRGNTFRDQPGQRFRLHKSGARELENGPYERGSRLFASNHAQGF